MTTDKLFVNRLSLSSCFQSSTKGPRLNCYGFQQEDKRLLTRKTWIIIQITINDMNYKSPPNRKHKLNPVPNHNPHPKRSSKPNANYNPYPISDHNTYLSPNPNPNELLAHCPNNTLKSDLGEVCSKVVE
ncbi:unnamed protein product [Trichobilharzia regenti]|nr:unnamed protein product [Trichobilharzia regenti]